jgi:hypothetical protein
MPKEWMNADWMHEIEKEGMGSPPDLHPLAFYYVLFGTFKSFLQ